MSEQDETISAGAYLGRVIRILIDDGRLLEGELQCFDKDMNFVLTSTTEYYGVPLNDAGGALDTTSSSSSSRTATGAEREKRASSRFLGMATAPGKHVVKVLAAPLA